MFGLVVLADWEVALGCVQGEHSVAVRALLLDIVPPLLFGFFIAVVEGVGSGLLLIADATLFVKFIGFIALLAH